MTAIYPNKTIPNLIKELKTEHANILSNLQEAKSLGINSENSRRLILDAKQLLLDHLQKEDERLYPVLKKVAERDKPLQKLIKEYADDMDKISKFALEFFERFNQNILGADTASSFKLFFNTLMSRIVREERILFKEYDKIEVQGVIK